MKGPASLSAPLQIYSQSKLKDEFEIIKILKMSFYPVEVVDLYFIIGLFFL